ncbi:MAG: MFS family permease [Spirosomataceae bacterium]|jgi:MFS family permease
MDPTILSSQTALSLLPDLKEVLINTFESFISKFIEFVPNVVVAMVVITTGVLIGKILSKVVDKVLSQIGFNKLGDKINEIEAIKKFDFKLSKVVGKLLYYFVLLVFIIAAADTLGVPAISNMVLLLVEFIPKIISAAIMVLVGVLLADMLRKFVADLCASSNVSSGKLISSAVFFFVLIIVVIASLAQAGVNTDLLEFTFSVLVGGVILAFSIGYGFASKEILLNIISSFYSKKKYKIGQTIEIDGAKGEVIDVDNTTLSLKTSDQVTVLLLRLLQTHKAIVYTS